ncbi:hypothetical protein PENTCL1PPCAC_8214, partial [Pristionchus entomophagus]
NSHQFQLTMSETELKCPECEYKSSSRQAFIMHLRLKHSITPYLADLTFLCICGYELQSHVYHQHDYEQEREIGSASFTIIRNTYQPVRRLTDGKTTPKCVLCEMYPATVSGYISHLKIHHKSTLKKCGIFIECVCYEGMRYGVQINSNSPRVANHKALHPECNGRRFKLHKIPEYDPNVLGRRRRRPNPSQKKKTEAPHPVPNLPDPEPKSIIVRRPAQRTATKSPYNDPLSNLE